MISPHGTVLHKLHGCITFGIALLLIAFGSSDQFCPLVVLQPLVSLLAKLAFVIKLDGLGHLCLLILFCLHAYSFAVIFIRT